jgi:WhiB family redox-sensing transcriptional regulator
METLGVFDVVGHGQIWKLQGSCSKSQFHDLWYSSGKEEIKLAKQMCYQCPVIKECLIYAFENNEDYGIWGGMTEQERRKAKNGH